MSMNLDSLTPEQIEILTLFAEQQEIVTQISMAALQGDEDTFEFTIAGMTKGKDILIKYFRNIRDFLNRDSIAKLLEEKK